MKAGTYSTSHHRREEAMGDRFQCLPAEIRNEIFHLALIRDAPVEVTQRWPGISGTCKQFREETLAIYFGNNSFTARITDLEDTPLVTWLEKVEGVPLQYKNSITSLTILTEKKLVHTSISASYEYYDNIIAHIKQAGLGASQIVWPSALLAGIAAKTWTNRTPTTYPFPTQVALDDTLLHDNILPPLLNRHGLRSSANPSVNVLREMIGIYGNGVAASMRRARDRRDGPRLLYGKARRSATKDKPWWAKRVQDDPGWEERNGRYRAHRRGVKELERITLRAKEERLLKAHLEQQAKARKTTTAPSHRLDAPFYPRYAGYPPPPIHLRPMSFQPPPPDVPHFAQHMAPPPLPNRSSSTPTPRFMPGPPTLKKSSTQEPTLPYQGDGTTPWFAGIGPRSHSR